MSDNAEVDNLIETIKKEAAHLGLHMKDVMIASDADMSDPQVAAQLEGKSMKEILDDPDSEVGYAVMIYFLVGDLAFSDRVQNPEAFDEKQQFDMIVPSERELLKDKVVDKIAKLRDNGGDEEDFLSAMFDDDEDF